MVIEMRCHRAESLQITFLCYIFIIKLLGE